MANWIEARQRISDQRFEMAVESDESPSSAHALGYCAGFRELEDFQARARSGIHEQLLKNEIEAARPFKDKYHRDGHATKEEAHACWESYQLDRELRFRDEDGGMKRCLECQEWTAGRGYLLGPYSMCDEHVLCKKHQTRDCVASARAKRREARRAGQA